MKTLRLYSVFWDSKQ